ncbi:hypothetical protein ABTQ33_11500 [Paucilactobacillus suebicus]
MLNDVLLEPEIERLVELIIDELATTWISALNVTVTLSSVKVTLTL